MTWFLILVSCRFLFSHTRDSLLLRHFMKRENFYNLVGERSRFMLRQKFQSPANTYHIKADLKLSSHNSLQQKYILQRFIQQRFNVKIKSL